MGGFEVNPNISSRHVWVGFKLCNPNLTNDACFFLFFSHMYYFNLLFRWFFPTRMISILRQVMGDDWFTQPGSTTVTKAILHHAALHKAAIWQDFVQLFKKHEFLTKLKVNTQKCETKGQLISKRPFGVFFTTKKPSWFFKDFCPSLQDLFFIV